MDIRRTIIGWLLCFTASTTFANQEQPEYIKPAKTYRYRVYFANKDNNPYSIKRPEAFLSAKSIERRKKYNIKVDEYDLPVTPMYLKYISKQGGKVLHTSKWNNTAVIEINDTTLALALEKISYVTHVKKIWESQDSIRVVKKTNRFTEIENQFDTIATNYYGFAGCQAQMLRANQLHEAGYKGQGITIAVIDGGFYNADTIQSLRGCKILGTRNFVEPQKSVYETPQDHGTMVLSCIATQMPYVFVGTAPEASFYLLQSEDTNSENIVEEDNWCAAIEYADSLGVDIVTSSLGYYKFDDPSVSHKYHEQDGKTAMNSRSASLAASRGLLVLNSAGNEGNGAWKKIGFPADAHNILAVGAVNHKGINADFSSVGNTTDGRIKPEVMAMGANASVFDFQGNLSVASGTSFSCPILCGAAACLLQAFPKMKPTEIIDAIIRSGNNYSTPNNIYGYGIPDFWKAYELLQSNP